MSEYQKWRDKQSIYTKVQLSGAEQCIDLKIIFDAGQETKNKQILNIIRPCLVRDRTLQKLIRQIEELKGVT